MRDILLLHGAIGSKSQLQPMADLLKKTFNVHSFNLPGHGGEPFPAKGFSIEYFADVVYKYVEDNAIEKISIFGYSMGGYVAMMFAKKYPDRVEGVITLATKFNWDEEISAKEIKMLQPEIIEEKIPAFAIELANRHAPLDWKQQLWHTEQLLSALGRKNALELKSYESIETPCLLMLGDRDKMVTLIETVEVYNQLRNGALLVLPKTSHPIEKADKVLLSFHIEQFLEGIK